MLHFFEVNTKLFFFRFGVCQSCANIVFEYFNWFIISIINEKGVSVHQMLPFHFGRVVYYFEKN